MNEESLDLLEDIIANIQENKNNLEILVSYSENNPEARLDNISELLKQISTKQKKVLDDINKFSCELYKYLFKPD